MCDKFQPTILQGQRCYSLDVNKLGKKPTRQGKEYGLFLLLDPNPFAVEKNIEIATKEKQSFKVFIHTLAQYVTDGPGSYGMTALKKTTHTRSFEELPTHQRKCIVHNREYCQTQKYLDQVSRECKCIPWALVTHLNRDEVRPKSSNIQHLSELVLSVGQ